CRRCRASALVLYGRRSTSAVRVLHAPGDPRGPGLHLLATPGGKSRIIFGGRMSRESRRVARILLVILPTVMYRGASLLGLLINDPRYMQNPLRQNLWRAGHAHAGVLLVLSLVALRYVDETRLSSRLKWFVRLAIPAAAILLPSAFFLSVLRADAT